MGVRVVRVQIKSLAIGRFRLVEPAQRLEGVAKVVARLDEIRTLGERRLELLDPFPDVARLATDHGAQVQRTRVFGLAGQNLTAQSPCLVDLPGLVVFDGAPPQDGRGSVGIGAGARWDGFGLLPSRRPGQLLAAPPFPAIHAVNALLPRQSPPSSVLVPSMARRAQRMPSQASTASTGMESPRTRSTSTSNPADPSAERA